MYASPLRRATQTAHRTAERHRLPVQIDARLRERANWGDLPDRSLAEFVAMWERSTANPQYAPPVWESDLLDQWRPAFLARQSQLVAECSITLVEVTATGYTLQGFADTTHLSATDSPRSLA
jgi:hypothetical protein